MKSRILIVALAFLCPTLVHADGTKPVTSGVVIRGVTLTTPPGAPGTKAAATCDFSNEPVAQNGTMTGASVQCGPSTVKAGLEGLPNRFNAYCVVQDAGKLPGAARLISASIPGNANHCDLSGVTPKDATGFFGGATWR